VDQLGDASSCEISSYTSWYGWVFFFSYLIVGFSQRCVCESFSPVSTYIAPLLLTLSVCSNQLFCKWLIEEPVSHNPLRLIFKVLKYAIKNKYPCLKSSYVYRNNRCSRFDVAKEIFGGPFTAEEVEDVKTFFRIVVIITFGSLIVGHSYITDDAVMSRMLQHYQDQSYVRNCSFSSPYMKDCFVRSLVHEIDSLTMVIFIPIFEVILYPWLWKYVKLGIMKKFILGVILQLLYHLSLLVLEIVCHYLTSMDSSLPTNFTVICMLELVPNSVLTKNVLSLDFKWIAVVKVLQGFSIYCFLTACIEFILAQSPYSMKGLLAGVLFFVFGLSNLLFVTLRQLFKLLPDFGSPLLGCGVWYFLFASILTFIFIISSVAVAKWYSKRTRVEAIHREDMFAVNSYQQRK